MKQLTRNLSQEPYGPKKRLTFGFLAPAASGSIEVELWKVALEFGAARDVNMVFFSGGGYSYTLENRQQRNSVYDLVDVEYLDGLVVFGGLLVEHLGKEGLRQFCSRHYPLPMVSVSAHIPGIPSVMVDNYAGQRAVLQHLIEVHGCRRLAYVRGSDGNVEASTRYQAYVDTLDEFDIPFDESLVLQGDFSLEAGRRAVAILLDERKVECQAIVLANDNMAVGVLRELELRGFRVPYDFAVVGFDDIPESHLLSPPLTSVLQSWYDIGMRAFETLLDQISGKPVQSEVSFAPDLIIRQSCGCMLSDVAQASVTLSFDVRDQERWLLPPDPESLRSALAQVRERTALEMRNVLAATSQDLDPQWSYTLFESFVESLILGAADLFLNTLDKTLHKMGKLGVDIFLWNGVISALRRGVLPHLPERDTSRRAENFWQQARVLVTTMVGRVQVSLRLQQRDMDVILQDFGQALITTFDIGRLMDLIAQKLPSLGVRQFYLALYESPEPLALDARLILGYSEAGRVDTGPTGLPFSLGHLLSPGFLPEGKPHNLVVEPLYFQEHRLGFIVFCGDPRSSLVCSALRGQLSSALRGSLLVQQVEARAAQVQTAADVAHVVGSILDLQELLSRVVDLVCERFKLYYAGLFLVDQTGAWSGEANRWAVLRAGTGEAGQKMIALEHKLEIGGTSMIGACVARKQARIAMDVGDEATRFDNPLLPDTHSELALPLISRGHVIGALSIQSTKKNAFNEDDITILQTMASQVSVVIENTRLYEQAQSALEEMEATQRRYQQRVWSEYLSVAPVTSYESHLPEVAPVGDKIIPAVKTAISQQSLQLLKGADSGVEGHSALVVPTALRGGAIGVLGVHSDDPARVWTEDQIALVEAIAERMALAADNLRLLDASQRRASREQLTREITDKMRRATSMESLVQTAVHEMATAFGTSNTFVQLNVPQEEKQTTEEGTDED